MSRRDALETVQRLRRIREQQAQTEVSAARREVAQADDAVHAARDAASAVELPGSLPAELLLSLQLRGLASVENIALAEQEWERAVQRQRDATRRLVKAAADRKSIEKLAQRREAEALAVRAVAAERSLDELQLIRRREQEVPS